MVGTLGVTGCSSKVMTSSRALLCFGPFNSVLFEWPRHVKAYLVYTFFRPLFINLNFLHAVFPLLSHCSSKLSHINLSASAALVTCISHIGRAFPKTRFSMGSPQSGEAAGTISAFQHARSKSDIGQIALVPSPAAISRYALLFKRLSSPLYTVRAHFCPR